MSVSRVKYGQAYVEISGDDSKLQKALKSSAGRMRAYGDRMAKLGGGMLRTGALMAAPMALAIKSFAGFDDAMRGVKAVTGSTGQQFDNLTQQAAHLGRTTSFTAKQVADAMLQLGRAGFDSSQIREATDDVLALARATGTDLTEATILAAGTMRTFGLNAKDMGLVTDVLTATANNSAQTLTEFGEAMKFAGPVADAYGLSIQETAKAVGALANFNIKGSVAGTTLKNVMLRLADPKIQDAVKNLIPDANFNDIGTLLADLGESMANLPKLEQLAIMNDLFGRRAVAGGIKLVTSEFKKMNKAIDDAAGIAKKTAEQMDAGIGGAARRLWSAIEGLANAFGDALAPQLSEFAETITGLARVLAEWVGRNKWLAESLAKIAAVLLIGGGILTTYGLLIKGVGAAMAMLASTVIPQLVTALTFLAAHPVIASLGLFVAGVYAVTRAMESQEDQVESLAEAYEKLYQAQNKFTQNAIANAERANKALARSVEQLKTLEGELGKMQEDIALAKLSSDEKQISKAKKLLDARLRLIDALKKERVEAAKLEDRAGFASREEGRALKQEEFLKGIGNARQVLAEKGVSEAVKRSMRDAIAELTAARESLAVESQRDKAATEARLGKRVAPGTQDLELAAASARGAHRRKLADIAAKAAEKAAQEADRSRRAGNKGRAAGDMGSDPVSMAKRIAQLRLDFAKSLDTGKSKKGVDLNEGEKKHRQAMLKLSDAELAARLGEGKAGVLGSTPSTATAGRGGFIASTLLQGDVDLTKKNKEANERTADATEKIAEDGLGIQVV